MDRQGRLAQTLNSGWLAPRGNVTRAKRLARRWFSTLIELDIPHGIDPDLAAGMIAFTVGMTEPTVAPMPRWTSGIAATWWWTIDRFEMLTSCWRAADSISPV